MRRNETGWSKINRMCCSPALAARQPGPFSNRSADSTGNCESSEDTSTVAICSTSSQRSSGLFVAALWNGVIRFRIDLLFLEHRGRGFRRRAGRCNEWQWAEITRKRWTSRKGAGLCCFHLASVWSDDTSHRSATTGLSRRFGPRGLVSCRTGIKESHSSGRLCLSRRSTGSIPVGATMVSKTYKSTDHTLLTPCGLVFSGLGGD